MNFQNNIIYADNAATTSLDLESFERMQYFLLNNYSNPSQPYSFSQESKSAIKKARNIIAKCINANDTEIYFTSGGSESDNWAIKMACGKKNKCIITSKIEHHAILNSCANSGCEVYYLPVDNTGLVYISDLENTLKHLRYDLNYVGEILVSIMMVNNEIGTIEPIKELAKTAHKYNAIFHTDAVQAVGHINIDVNDLGIDMLSASSHKFNGPKGCGFLFIRQGIVVNELINGGSQEFKLRAGTENVASIVGMAIALKNNCDTLLSNLHHLENLENHFFEIFDKSKIDYVRNGNLSHHLLGNINLSFKGFSGEAILHRMDLFGICISTGSACDSVNTQVSHVIKAINVKKDYAEGTIRISLSKNNTLSEVERIANCLIKICSD